MINAGYRNTEIVNKGTEFLRTSQRKDGGWPIDIDLSTWVTSLSEKALRGQLDYFLTEEAKNNITRHFKSIQNKQINPFNGTPPGGWGWIHYAGSVPDGDDTPGIILSLLKLQPKKSKK